MDNTSTDNPIVLSATQKLLKTIEAAAKGVNLDAVVAEADRLSEEVAISTIKLNKLEESYTTKAEELTAEYDTKVRRANIDFGLKIEENENREFDKLLTKRNSVALSKDAVSELKNAAVYNEEKTASDIASAVKSAEGKLHSSYKAQLSTLDSNHKVAVAQTDARVTALESEIKFLQKSLEQAQANLEADREAQIQMSSNAAQPTINVNGK